MTLEVSSPTTAKLELKVFAKETKNSILCKVTFIV